MTIVRLVMIYSVILWN